MEEVIIAEKINNFQILEFVLENDNSMQKYAIEISYLNEVHTVKKVTTLPCTPSFIIGIVNFRGKIISVIDIRNFLGFTTHCMESDTVRKIIVVKVNELELGIAVDGILGCNEISLLEVQKNISSITSSKAAYFKGISKESCIILDIKNIILDEKIIVNEEVI